MLKATHEGKLQIGNMELSVAVLEDGTRIIKQSDVFKALGRPARGNARVIGIPTFMDAKNLPLNCVNKQYCSATLAVLNDGTVSPCATIRDGCTENVNELDFYNIVINNRDYLCFKQLKEPLNLPKDCQQCGLNHSCWGCRSRAYASGEGLFGKDPRCFRRN